MDLGKFNIVVPSSARTLRKSVMPPREGKTTQELFVETVRLYSADGRDALSDREADGILIKIERFLC